VSLWLADELAEAPDRLGHAEFRDPGWILFGRVSWDWIWSDAPAIASVDAIQQSLLLGQEVDEGLAVVWNKGIEIDELNDALARSIGDARGDHATIAMANQHNVSQIVESEDADNVLDVSIEIVFWPRQMRSLA
jgi:hypothetical protein